jgi:hypothetical protein
LIIVSSVASNPEAIAVAPRIGAGSLLSVTPKGPGLSAGLNLHSSRPILTHRKETGTAKAVRLGTVEAPDEAVAIEKAAAKFKVPATKLMAIRR